MAEFCLDCGKLLYEPVSGIFAGCWTRAVQKEDGGPFVDEGVVCNECHEKGVEGTVKVTNGA